jgi:uncharacterized protein
MNIQQKTKDKLKRVWTFLSDQTVLNIATSKNDAPYCASCFYVFDEKCKMLAFKSKKDSRHIAEALQQKNVAGTILPDQLKLGTVKGIQFQGNLVFPDHDTLTNMKGKYYGKFPYARAVSGDIWIIELNFIKMTDNQLGFGKKLIWHKDL